MGSSVVQQMFSVLVAESVVIDLAVERDQPMVQGLVRVSGSRFHSVKTQQTCVREERTHF